MLWEVFVNLVAKHGHAEAEKRMLAYVIGGLKLTPPRPTFTQARDGILSAVSAMSAGICPKCGPGFAKRGMGSGAASPPSSLDVSGRSRRKLHCLGHRRCHENGSVRPRRYA